MTMQYVTCCVAMPMSEVDDLTAMIDRNKQITYRTALRRIGVDAMSRIFPDYDWRRRPHYLTMPRDWHVSYHRSEFRGNPCVYVRHSAIEYIFV